MAVAERVGKLMEGLSSITTVEGRLGGGLGEARGGQGEKAEDRAQLWVATVTGSGWTFAFWVRW